MKIKSQKDFFAGLMFTVMGGAFFEVTKDATHPFVVFAEALVVKVVGTSFTIQDAGAGHPAQVYVKTGRVAVYDRASQQLMDLGLMEPGQWF